MQRNTHEPIGPFRFAIHTGPCGVKETAAKLRGQTGYGFDILEGTESVYLSAFLPAQGDGVSYASIPGGYTDFVATRVADVIGWKPWVRIMPKV